MGGGGIGGGRGDGRTRARQREAGVRDVARLSRERIDRLRHHERGPLEGGLCFSLLPRRAVPELFETLAIGDLAFPHRYVDGRRFNVLFAEVLFKRFDADDDGFLRAAEAQQALQPRPHVEQRRDA